MYAKNFCLSLAIVLALISNDVSGGGIPRNVTELMKQVARNCQEIREVDFSQPENKVRSAMETFAYSEKYIKRDVEQLEKEYPDFANSNHEIWGTPFSKVYSDCRTKIAAIHEGEQEKVAAKPSDNALKALDGALYRCGLGYQWLSDPDETEKHENTIVDYYESYLELINQARSLDERVNAYGHEAITNCETNFVPAARKHAAAIEEKRKAQALAAAEKQERDVEFAEDMGFKDVYYGLGSFVGEIASGMLSMDHAEDLLVEASSSDFFKIQSVLDDLVVYAYWRNSTDFIQIGVEREDDKVYLDEQPLAGRYFALVDVEEMVTVFGARKQVLIFKPIEP